MEIRKEITLAVISGIVSLLINGLKDIFFSIVMQLYDSFEDNKDIIMQGYSKAQKKLVRYISRYNIVLKI